MSTSNKLKKKEMKNKILIILRLFKPCIFNVSSSFLVMRSKKKNCDEIKKINGKTSNKFEAAFNKDIKKGNKKLISKFLKKFISSKIFKITIKHKNIKEVINIFL